MDTLKLVKLKAEDVFNTDFEQHFQDENTISGCVNNVSEEGLDEFDKYALEMEHFFKQNNLTNWICEISTCGSAEELYSVDIVIFESE